MTNTRLALVAFAIVSLFACQGGGESPTQLAQDVVVQVVPRFAALTPGDSRPFSALVTGAVSSSVTWEIAEPEGGLIDANGVYSAPDTLGVFTVVARSTAQPAAAATAEVTVTATRTYATGRAMGVNLSWWNYWDSQALADTARQGFWEAAGGGHLTRSDADGWPAQDFRVGFGVFETGTYAIRFTGQATLSASGGTISGQSYDAATNVTTANYVVGSLSTGGPSGYIDFRNTRRQPADGPGTGATAVTIMRPGRQPDVGTAATRFENDYIAAVQNFQWFRPMQTFGLGGKGVMGNTDVYWSDADAVAAGVAAYDGAATYGFGDKILANGKVYLATFRNPEIAKAAGGIAPNHHTKSCFGEGPTVDGAVYWGRAARVKPNGRAGSQSGPAWEDLIMLANRSHVAPWFTIPYFATDLYVTKLARLIKYGSDATGEPYTSPQARPVFPPLDPALPFILEWSNEIWNGAEPYPASYNWRIADTELKAGNPWRYLQTTNYWARGPERAAMLTARMSLLFRAVFGDAEMMTRVRPVLAWQLAGVDGLDKALGYLNTVWGPGSAYDTLGPNALPNPRQAVSYYLYGVAGAPYNDWVGGTVDALFADWAQNLTTDLTPRLNAFDARAKTYGIRSLSYEGGNQQPTSGATTASLVTLAQQDARYTSALQDLTHAFWNTPNGTADVYVHFRMDCSAANDGLGYPVSTSRGGSGNYVTTYQQTIVNRNTPAWDAMRALRIETGR